MGGLLSILTPVVTVEPGGEAVATVRMQNTSDIVEQYSFSVLGDTTEWATVEPPVLSVYPSAEGSVSVRFRPPRRADIVAGAVPFGVRVTAKEDADFAQVEEGTVQIGGFAALEARIVPRTSHGRTGAKHRIELTNNGNSVVRATLEPIDPDDVLLFDCDPWEVDVPAASTIEAELKLRSKERVAGTPLKRRGFQVRVDNSASVPILLDAAFEQKKRFPFILVALFLIAAAVGIVFLLNRPDPRGLRAAYFENVDMSGEAKSGELISDFADSPGALSRNFDRRQPPGITTQDFWSARFTGEILFPDTGIYTIEIQADDGARVFIDGQMIIDSFVPGSGFKPPGQFENQKANTWHDIRVEYFEGDGTALIRLFWTPPGGTQEIVPGENLRPPRDE